MANTKISKKSESHNDSTQGQEVEVLYQKMGDRWFAFSLIDDEVFVGSITPEDLQAGGIQKTHGGRKPIGTA